MAFFHQVDNGGGFFGRRAVNRIILIGARNIRIGRNFEHIEAVNIHKFFRLGQRRAGHARQCLIKAEVILKRNAGQSLVFRLNGDIFFCFQSLMQPVGKTPPFHHAAGKFINDNHLTRLTGTANNIITVFLEQNMGAQRIGDVMHKRDILNVVNRGVFFQKAVFNKQFFHMLIAVIRQIDGFGFLVQFVIVFAQLRNQFINADIEVGAVFQRPGNNQRGARLVNENAVHLINNGKAVAALAHIGARIFHIVAQIIKTQLIIGGIGNVCRISAFARFIIHIMDNTADAQPQSLMHDTHPIGIALGEIIIDRHHMHGAARQGVQITRQSGDQCFAFAGFHFRNGAIMQHHAANHLHIIMALAQSAARRFAHRGKGFFKNIVKRFTIGEAGFELLRFGL